MNAEIEEQKNVMVPLYGCLHTQDIFALAPPHS